MPGIRPICWACDAELQRDLAEVPALEVDLGVTLSRQTRTGDREGGRPAETALPWDQRAATAAAELHATLVRWHRVLAKGAPRVAGPICLECRHSSCEWSDLGRAPADTLADISRWVIRHRVRLLRHPAVAEAVDDLRAAVRGARRAIDRPPATWYAGPCRCGADLNARHGAPMIRCRACGAHVTTAAQVRWLLAEAADHLGTATEIARLLHPSGMNVTAAMIRGYAHRGALVARGRAGHPLYRIGDVLDLLGGVLRPAGPACVTCQHRTCQQIRGKRVLPVA
ncbi:hypothetical protein [Sphaerisporangium sp. TRM90804]|uniref:hypothetical protein n=1 Tax=Sphaerisporangium sp. TRM90804 TaxID=3031113 RepID=UPI002448F75D|nr:hypothetical protein [Sphaerisporangium sp. TRM90804]MDH2425761.1 hypothetical protein [Sphaerisporangium sp. TRM90804]